MYPPSVRKKNGNIFSFWCVSLPVVQYHWHLAHSNRKNVFIFRHQLAGGVGSSSFRSPDSGRFSTADRKQSLHNCRYRYQVRRYRPRKFFTQAKSQSKPYFWKLQLIITQEPDWPRSKTKQFWRALSVLDNILEDRKFVTAHHKDRFYNRVTDILLSK